MKHSPQQWHVLSLTVDEHEADDIAALLFEYDPNGIEEVAADDGAVILHAYFGPDARSFETTERTVRDALPGRIIRAELLEWDPGDDSWRQYFKPFTIVPGITVAPTWENYRPSADERVITIDPGMAFGTGLHPTTRLTARAIYDRCHRAPAASLIDVGCGTGILSIVASMLGIAKVAAVENDEVAAEIARENFIKNGVRHVSVHASLADIDEHYEMVVANILLNTLIDLSGEIVTAIAPGGYLLLSGITGDQTEALLKRYAARVEHLDTIADGEWRCMIFKN